MTDAHVLVRRDGDVTTLTINRPDVLNAMTRQTVDELREGAEQAASDGARALLITGAGRAFSSGADLAAGAANPAATSDMGAGLEAYFNPMAEAFRAADIPIVAAVNGPAAGAGCSLALLADFVIAGRSAYFLQAFANIGLVPDVGATWVLPRLVGVARATEMMMLAERIPAEKAENWGLIHRCVADDVLMDEAAALAHRLAAGPTTSYALIRHAIDRAQAMTFTQSLALERENQRTAGRTADHREGVMAFLEKRRPTFRGA